MIHSLIRIISFLNNWLEACFRKFLTGCTCICVCEGGGVCRGSPFLLLPFPFSRQREREKEVPSPPSLRPPEETVTLDPRAQILPAWGVGSTVLSLTYGPCFRVRQTGFSRWGFAVAYQLKIVQVISEPQFFKRSIMKVPTSLRGTNDNASHILSPVLGP